MKRRYVSIFWEDIHVYYDGEPRRTSFAFTEGLLCKESERYMFISEPETVLVGKTVRNHPQEKPCLYAIPKSLIREITYVD